MTETEGKKAVVVAQHRNVDAESTSSRNAKRDTRTTRSFDTLLKMEQDATEAAALAKAAAELDVPYQNMKSEREFASYAEGASLDKDLIELKAKL